MNVDIYEQFKVIEKRLLAIEQALSIIPGYECIGCKKRQPLTHYWYTATNGDTKEVIQPLCAPCVRGENTTVCVCGLPWKHAGPFGQPVKI